MTTPAHSPSPCRRRSGAALALLALLAGCAKQELVSYRVPKEKDAGLPVTVAASTAPASGSAHGVVAAPAGAGMADTPVATASGPGLTWTAPAAWQAKPLGPMRKGSFTIAGEAGATADLSITAFPGAVGGEFANVNRWRGQLGLAPIAEAELPAAVTRLSQSGLTFTVVDLVGTDAAPQRMLGAMAPYEGAMWFFKLTGPDALVAGTKPAFIEFLKSVKAPTP
jgi:hypothetical protein